MPISSLVVEHTGDGLVIKSRDGGMRFDTVEFFSELLSFMANDGFRILPRVSHQPRLAIDRLIVAREAWSFAASDLSFAHRKDAPGRFLGARRWASRQGMPRYVFVKVPVEKKPFYLDFESPIFVDLFAKAIRRTVESDLASSAVTLSEMLPTPRQLWLHDAAGRRYTSELRILAVDRKR